MKESFYSNGKLLLTGEYVVLDGAQALAIPTRYGQSLSIRSKNEPVIHWVSYDENGLKWFEGSYRIDLDGLISESDDWMNLTLGKILHTAREMNPHFLPDNKGFEIEASINFPRNWGLGTSSTLINNVAQWAEVDSFKLLEESFGGSGYDIAAAQNNTPIFYQRGEKSVLVSEANLSPTIIENSFFVFLNKKQDSKFGIARYREKGSNQNERQAISELSVNISNAKNVNELSKLMQMHEAMIAKIIDLPPVKSSLFSDYQGGIKSLGAWGGDFIWVIGNKDDYPYFENKGYTTIISFEDMLL